MSWMSIGEVARRTGLRTSALRFYEAAGILRAVPRVAGHRRYDQKLLRKVEVLRFAQRAGFTLAEIRTLFHEFDPKTPTGQRWTALAQAKLKELDCIVARAERMREALKAGIACNCARLDDCIIGSQTPRKQASPLDARKKG